MVSNSGSVQFSIGAVIGSSVGVYVRNFVSFSILALLIGLINLVFGFVFPAADPAAVGEANYTGIFLTFIVSVLVNGMTQAAIIYGTFQDLRGQKAGLGDCIARGIATMIPVIVGSIIFALGVGIGTLLLVIPGLILALMWWVYIPAIVVEGKGIMEGFSRSAELTSGRRWHILGLLIVIILLSFLAGIVAMLIIGIAVAGGGVVAALIINYIVMSLVTAFSAILVAVGYYYLRAEKEGINVDDIARVFD